MNQPDSPEFTEILNRVPRWHMLTPGVDVWREGDESLENAYDGEGDFEPHPYDSMHIVGGFSIGRRPIPENVRRSMAQLCVDQPENQICKFWMGVGI